MVQGDRLISIGEPLTARPKTFSTGSRGFYVWGKATIDGKRYQFSGNLVEIGSKNEKKTPQRGSPHQGKRE
jgi:hypothetical protein